MLYYKIIVGCLLLLYYSGNAQKITTIPFEELYGGVIVVKATIDNKKDTLNFVLDTGSSHISLDSTTAVALKIPVQKTNSLINGIGGIKKASRTNPLALHFKNLTLDSIAFNVNDYTLLQESYGEHIDGIIGFAFISKYILAVNFDNATIEIHKRGDYKYPKKGYLWKYNLEYIPTVNLPLKDREKQQIPLFIDCGAGLSLLLSENFITDSTFLNPKKKPINAQIDGIGGKATTRLTTTKELRLGPYKFKNVPTYLYNDTFNLLHYPATMGLLGNDVLRRFNWVLNYAKKEWHLTPNKSFDDEFDYAYTGLSIYYIDGLLTITEVQPNSPASVAGIQEGDILLSINSTIITSLKQAKDAFQQARRKIKIIVIRNSKPKEIYMRVKSIL